MGYHEVRIVAELRKQGEHEKAEEFRLKAMRRTRSRRRSSTQNTLTTATAYGGCAALVR